MVVFARFETVVSPPVGVYRRKSRAFREFDSCLRRGGSDNQSMPVGNDEQISRLMETANRLRLVRAAQRRFLTLWAVDHPEAIEELARERDRVRADMAEFLRRSNTRWSN